MEGIRKQNWKGKQTNLIFYLTLKRDPSFFRFNPYLIGGCLFGGILLDLLLEVISFISLRIHAPTLVDLLVPSNITVNMAVTWKAIGITFTDSEGGIWKIIYCFSHRNFSINTGDVLDNLTIKYHSTVYVATRYIGLFVSSDNTNWLLFGKIKLEICYTK